MYKNKTILILTIAFFLHSLLYAAVPFSMKIKVFLTAGFDDDVFYEPANNTIKVRDYFPKKFQVEIKNSLPVCKPMYQ